MKILILADVHLGVTTDSPVHPGEIRLQSTSAGEKLKKIIEDINKEHYDLVFNVGDIIKATGNIDTDKALLNDALDILSTIDQPVATLLGNHELRSMDKDYLREAYLQKRVSFEFFGFQVIKNVKFIWFDPEMEGSRAYISPERMTWLSAVLESPHKKVIFSHYPFSLQGTKDNFYFNEDNTNAYLKNSEEIHELLYGNSVLMSVNAHTHWMGHVIGGEYPMITAPAFSENIAGMDYPENNPGIYSILEIKPESMSFKSFSGKYCFSKLTFKL
jgi:3',5'-cyclic AMP phosphodiesterase CpdA